MSKKIESLIINNFKGATNQIQIDFDKNKSIIMIFGENGTGKSTISDAFDFICNNNFGSILDKSLPTKKTYELVASLGKDFKDIDIQIKYDNKFLKAVIGKGNKPLTIPNTPPKARILRRCQILKIVNSQAKDRYEGLKEFIEVPNCDKNEENLRKALDNISKQYDEAVRSYTQAEESLDELWNAEGAKDKNSLKWAENQTIVSNLDQERLNSLLKNVIEKINLCNRQKSNYDLSNKAYNESTSNLNIAEKKLEENKNNEFKSTQILIGILQESKKYFEQNKSIVICPVCERSGIETDKLLKRLQDRLDEMKTQKELKERISKLNEEVNKNETLNDDCFKKYITEIKNLIIELNKEEIKNALNKIINLTDYIYLLNENKKISINKYDEFYNKSLNIKNDILSIQENIQKQINQFNAIKSHLKTIKEKKENATNLEEIKSKMEKLNKIIETERKFFIEEVLKEISEEVERTYSIVHPNEEIGKIKFYLKENTQGSLEFSGDFHKVDNIPPQAYYSESHLDTLGVSVWLALTKHYKEDDMIVILDDVITSVDQVHMDRFLEMIHEEAENYNQLIFTTHYRPWRDKYRHPSGQSGKVQLIELLHWSMPRGVQHTKTKLNIDELKEYIEKEPIERQIIASKAGILIESLLDSITLLYECKLPRKPIPDYTLNELSCSIDSKLKKLLKIEKIKSDGSVENIELKSLIDDLFQLSWIRNEVGCHFNKVGMNISDDEVKQMGLKTYIFANSLICEKCGEMPYKNKSGSYFECKCGNTKLFPLVNPN